MGSNLYEYLRAEWHTNNLPKYFHYFDEWVKNLTTDQINGFTKHMDNTKL